MNVIKHEKRYSYNWLVYQCIKRIQQLLKTPYPWLKGVPDQWGKNTRYFK